MLSQQSRNLKSKSGNGPNIEYFFVQKKKKNIRVLLHKMTSQELNKQTSTQQLKDLPQIRK